MRELEREAVVHAVSLLRDLARRLEEAETAREAEEILREAVGSASRMQDRMYRARLIADPLGVMSEAAAMKRAGKDFL